MLPSSLPEIFRSGKRENDSNSALKILGIAGVEPPILSRTASRKNIRFDLNVEQYDEHYSSSVSTTQKDLFSSPDKSNLPSHEPPTLLHADEDSSSSETAGRGMRISFLESRTGRRAKMKLSHDDGDASSSDYSSCDEGMSRVNRLMLEISSSASSRGPRHRAHRMMASFLLSLSTLLPMDSRHTRRLRTTMMTRARLILMKVRHATTSASHIMRLLLQTCDLTVVYACAILYAELDLYFKNKYKEDAGPASSPLSLTENEAGDGGVPASAKILHDIQDRIAGVGMRGAEILANAWDVAGWVAALPRQSVGSLFGGWM